MQDLRTTFLVCRSWGAAGRYVLYSKIHFYSPTSTARLLRTLARRTGLRTLVREAEFHYYARDVFRRWGPFQIGRSMYIPLSWCPSLRRLCLPAVADAPLTSIGDIALLLPIGELRGLLALQLTREQTVRRGRFAQLLQQDAYGATFPIRDALPRLEDLSLRDFDLRALRVSSLPRLQRLIVDTNRITPASLQTLLDGCGPGLFRFDLGCYNFAQARSGILAATTSQTNAQAPIRR